nr:hypothetical protein [Candidatus Freyarchaeota archaeon]
MKIGLPYKDWGLEFDSKGFEVVEQELSESFDSIYLRLSNDKTGIIISITLEPACIEGGTNIDCRDFYWSRMKELPIQRENIVMKEFKKMAVLEYFIPKIEGLEVGQKNLNAFMVKDDIWIDIHISKTQFNEKDLNHFTQS